MRTIYRSWFFGGHSLKEEGKIEKKILILMFFLHSHNQKLQRELRTYEKNRHYSKHHQLFDFCVVRETSIRNSEYS